MRARTSCGLTDPKALTLADPARSKHSRTRACRHRGLASGRTRHAPRSNSTCSG